ncbi:MAG: hypothetical protein PHN74_00950 [Candidatus Pacebacteria bacterium]|nr:hypothetical protein [Candidatus Paceibacterota bacterium]
MKNKHKKIKIHYSQSDAPKEECERRAHTAFAVLFEETMRKMKAKKLSTEINKNYPTG